MNVKTSNYGAARAILGLAELALWSGIALGVFVAITGAGVSARGFGSTGLLAAVPGISIAIFCFIGIVVVQMTKASVDTADYTYQMLGIARDQLSVSKQALKQAEKATSYSEVGTPVVAKVEPKSRAKAATGDIAPKPQTAASSLQQAKPVPISPGCITEYRGTEIVRGIHGYEVLEHTFQNIELAKNFVDGRQLSKALNSTKEPAS